MNTGSVHADNMPTFLVSEAIAKYLPVKLGTDANTVDLADGATDVVIGFAQALGQSTVGGALAVKTSGFSLALAGGSITKGAKLTCTTAGALIATTTAGNVVCAIAMEAADSGDYFEIKIVEPKLYSAYA